MKNAASSTAPYAIRYANSTEMQDIKEAFPPYGSNDIGVRKNYSADAVPEYVFVTYGNITSRVLEAEKRLKDEGISAGTVLVELIAPYEVSSANVAQAIKGARAVMYVEEGIENGGFAMICENRIRREHPELSYMKTDIAGIKDFVLPREKCDIYDHAGLSASKIYERMRALISR
jgi:deoxyxylulose-5-phosphate synthase